jgi:hypothetical protein
MERLTKYTKSVQGEEKNLLCRFYEYGMCLPEW